MHRGSFPTMITPFHRPGGPGAALAIDYDAVDSLVDWYLANGCVGIFSPCQSSEMYNLTDEERLTLAARVNKAVAGRGQHVAVGTFGGDGKSLEDIAAFVNKMAKCCDVVVVITCMLDDFPASIDDPTKRSDDAVWQANAERLLALTPGVSLGLYECPVPYKRLVGPDLLKWCAGTGRFHFHKDTCCDVKQINAKIRAVKSIDTPFKFYNANVETLLSSLEAGGDGFSGISANFYPHLHSWMVAEYDRGQAQPGGAASEALQALQAFLAVAEAVVVLQYPASPKRYLQLHYPDAATPTTHDCRCNTSFAFTEQDDIRLVSLSRMARSFTASYASVGIKEVPLRKA